MARVTVEFYGIPRERIGRAAVAVEAPTIRSLLGSLRERFPDFAASCLIDDELRPEFLLSLDGREFTRDPDRPLKDVNSVLILTADVGG